MRAINPSGPSVPGISQAMLVTGDNLLFLSGHIALGNTGIVGADLATQLDQVFQNLQTTLREAGAGFEHVVRIMVYVCDYMPSMLPTIRTVRDRYVNPQRPLASALIDVAALALPEIVVEIDAIAAIPG